MNENTRLFPRNDGSSEPCKSEWTNRIIAFFTGELDDEESLTEHLAACPDCRKTVGTLYRGTKRFAEQGERETAKTAVERAVKSKPAETLKSRKATGG